MTESFMIPELTLGLRNFAAPSALGDVHAGYFAPLLDSRRAAAIASRWNGRVTAFDADRLEATMRMTLAGFANERYPKSAPDRRALTAQLEDACGDLFDQLDRLGVAQRAVIEATDETKRPRLWREWVEVLRAVFSAADRGWEQMQPLLKAAPPPSAKHARRLKRGESR